MPESGIRSHSRMVVSGRPPVRMGGVKRTSRLPSILIEAHLISAHPVRIRGARDVMRHCGADDSKHGAHEVSRSAANNFDVRGTLHKSCARFKQNASVMPGSWSYGHRLRLAGCESAAGYQEHDAHSSRGRERRGSRSPEARFASFGGRPVVTASLNR